MSSLISSLYHNPIVSGLLHTLVHELRRELKGCRSVLDLGCGPSSPIQFCGGIERRVGVEAFQPYLERSRAQRIHTEYIERKIESLEFADGEFDTVMMIEVLEHLPEELGLAILKKAERWASKKVIVSSPNGFVPQKSVDGNPLQTHLSGWDAPKMRAMGFSCRGLAGLKCLRCEVQGETMGDDLMTSIRFWPRSFWFATAAVSQVATYYAPSLAFELFCVKNIQQSPNG